MLVLFGIKGTSLTKKEGSTDSSRQIFFGACSSLEVVSKAASPAFPFWVTLGCRVHDV